MLSKKQKFFMSFLGLISLLMAVVVAAPFRSIPGLNKIENILAIEIWVKLGLAGLALLLALYPSLKKYALIRRCRENSKTVIMMAYYPLIVYVLGSIVNIIYTLSFDYTAVGMACALSEKVLGLVVAILAVYFVFAIYCIVRVHEIVLRLEKVGNIIFDCFALVIFACFVVLTWRVNYAYNNAYHLVDKFYLGNPLLFVILILVLVAIYVGIKHLSYVVKKDESLILHTDSDRHLAIIKQSEYNHAYNNTLDDFEDYFDEKYEEYEELDIKEISENEFEDAETSKPVVEVTSILEEDEEIEIGEVDEEEVELVDSEEFKQVEAEKQAATSELAQKQEELKAIVKKRDELEQLEAELRLANEAYDKSLKDFHQFKLDHFVPEVDPAKKKVKKIVPSFEKMVEYTNTFNDHEGFRVVTNAKGNLLKFYINKKMFLVMQSTNNDYRISFISTPEKFVDHLTSRPGELVVPKNLKDNSWIRVTNKGKEDPKFLRKVIKEAVQTAEQQIQDELAAKEAARKAKAAERRALKKAQKEAEKAAANNE